MRNILPPLIIVILVGGFMFKPLMQGDKVAGGILLGVVILCGVITLIGGIARGRNRYYNNYRRRGRY